jgi:hypothetical protein
MKYDTLTPEDIEPYLGGRSWTDLKVGDEIAFPEPDDTRTPESLVGRRIATKFTVGAGVEVFDGTIDALDASTGKHHVTYDDTTTGTYDFKTYSANFAFEGADGPGVCIIREL